MSMSGAIRAGRAFVELFADDSKLKRGLKNARRRLQLFGRQVQDMGRKMMQFGGMVAAPLVLSISIYANFEDQLSKVKAVTSGTAAEFEVLRDKAKELGRTTSFTASQVAEGMVELGRAGFDRTEIDQAIGAMLDLSRAADTELPEATAIAGATLRQFKLPASEMTRVADVLTATANGSAQTLGDLGEALKPVGPLAAEAGESLEEVSAAVAVLANNGIRGSLAGNALARAYKNLSTSATQAKLADLGIEATDAEGDLRPLAEIIAEIGEKTKDMGSAQRLSSFEELFGRGQAAALKLATSTKDLTSILDDLNAAQGRSSEQAKEMDNNIGGALRRLKSAAEGVAISVGEALAPEVANLAELLSKNAVVIGNWVGENKQAIVHAAKLAGQVAAVGAALFAFGTTLKFVAGVITAFNTVISASPLGLAAMAAAIGTVGLLVFVSRLDSATAAARRLREELAQEKDDEAFEATLDMKFDDKDAKKRFLQGKLKEVEGEIKSNQDIIRKQTKEQNEKSLFKRGAEAITGGGNKVDNNFENIALLKQRKARLKQELENVDLIPEASAEPVAAPQMPSLSEIVPDLGEDVDPAKQFFEVFENLPSPGEIIEDLKGLVPESITSLVGKIGGIGEDEEMSASLSGQQLGGSFSSMSGRMFIGQNMDEKKLEHLSNIDSSMRRLLTEQQETNTYAA